MDLLMQATLGVATLSVTLSLALLLGYVARAVLDPATTTTMRNRIKGHRVALVRDRISVGEPVRPPWDESIEVPGASSQEALVALGLPDGSARRVNERLTAARQSVTRHLAQSLAEYSAPSEYSVQQVDQRLGKIWMAARRRAVVAGFRETAPEVLRAFTVSIAARASLGVGVGIVIAAPVGFFAWIIRITGAAETADVGGILNAGLLLGGMSGAAWASSTLWGRLQRADGDSHSEPRIALRILTYNVAFVLLLIGFQGFYRVLENESAYDAYIRLASVVLLVFLLRVAWAALRGHSSRVWKIVGLAWIGLLVSTVVGWVLEGTDSEWPEWAVWAFLLLTLVTTIAFMVEALGDALTRRRARNGQADELGYRHYPVSPWLILVATYAVSFPLLLASNILIIEGLPTDWQVFLVFPAVFFPVAIALFQWRRRKAWEREMAQLVNDSKNGASTASRGDSPGAP